MPGYLVVITLGLFLGIAGYSMAFRQIMVRRLLSRPAPRRARGEDEDPLAYALRISGVMIMAFGIVISGMVAVLHISS